MLFANQGPTQPPPHHSSPCCCCRIFYRGLTQRENYTRRPYDEKRRGEMLNAAVSLPILSLCVWGFSFPLLFRPIFLYHLLFSDCEGLDTVAKSREKPTKSMVQANNYYVYTHTHTHTHWEEGARETLTVERGEREMILLIVMTFTNMTAAERERERERESIKMRLYIVS